MKKIYVLILSFVLALLSHPLLAQTTISYGQISSYCPQMGQMISAGGGAVAITFYDGYITNQYYGKLLAVQRNYDGSILYMPTQNSVLPFMQLDAILISSDRQQMEIHQTSTMGNMSMNLIDTYTSMGEDGGRATDRWNNALIISNQRDSGSNRNEYGNCRSCNGTGVNKTPNSGGSRSSWVAYYNSRGSECPYCGSYTDHYHDKCSSCNVPSY